MARKKQSVTLSQAVEKGIGALIPEIDISSSPSAEPTPTEAEKKTKKPRKRLKNQEAFKKTLDRILSMEISPQTVSEAVKSTPLGEKITYQEAILIAQVIKASNGDTQSAVFIRDTSGNKLKEYQGQENEYKPFEDF